MYATKLDGAAGGLVHELKSAHVRGLEVGHCEAIAARLACGGVREGGPVLGYSLSQFRRRWDQVKEIILVPLGLPQHDDGLAGFWVALHLGCCTAAVLALLEGDSRFSREFERDFR